MSGIKQHPESDREREVGEWIGINWIHSDLLGSIELKTKLSSRVSKSALLRGIFGISPVLSVYAMRIIS